MNGQTLAHVRRILTSSDRALIHAVTGAGHEHKLEVPAEAVHGVEPDQGFVLMVSWSLLPLPRAAEPAPPATRTPEPATPAQATAAQAAMPTAAPANAVDAEFMALMARTRRAPEPAVASPPPTPASTSPEQQIAALLGLAQRRPG